jgi:hypothetical protein
MNRATGSQPKLPAWSRRSASARTGFAGVASTISRCWRDQRQHPTLVAAGTASTPSAERSASATGWSSPAATSKNGSGSAPLQTAAAAVAYAAPEALPVQTPHDPEGLITITRPCTQPLTCD